MGTPPTDMPSKSYEIQQIFSEFRAKLDEISKRFSDVYPHPSGEEPKHPIENKCEKLAEIILEKQQESQDTLKDVERYINKKVTRF
jgi:hypothetical protein